jgi:Glycosyl hydrolase family 3 N terminal domain
VIACAKHFVGDGGTHKGINEGNTICSYKELEKIHMSPYSDCFDQGVCTVMASYSSWNGEPLHSSHFLITDVLKNKLGFKVIFIFFIKKYYSSFHGFILIIEVSIVRYAIRIVRYGTSHKVNGTDRTRVSQSQ